MAPLCGTSHNARCWLCTDSCGLFCAGLTVTLILFSQYTVTKTTLATRGALSAHANGRHNDHRAAPVGLYGTRRRDERANDLGEEEEATFGFGSLQKWAHAVMFNALAVLALSSHLKAMLSDPGAVPKNAEPLPSDAQRLRDAIAAGASHRQRKKGWCHRCASYKPPRAHHCNVTGRCVVKLDHYCPWTNNAIGVRNHKFFLLFIWYTFLMCVYALAILLRLAFAYSAATTHTQRVGRRGRHSSSRGPDASALDDLDDYATKRAARNGGGLRHRSARFDEDDDDNPIGVAALVVGMCAVLFGLFTSCMLCDQWSVLSTNIAKIDRLQGEDRVSNEVNEVFGGRTRGFHWHWLLPLHVDFPKGVRDDVMGFRLPPDDDDDDDHHHPRGKPTTTMHANKAGVPVGGGQSRGDAHSASHRPLRLTPGVVSPGSDDDRRGTAGAPHSSAAAAAETKLCDDDLEAATLASGAASGASGHAVSGAAADDTAIAIPTGLQQKDGATSGGGLLTNRAR